jgi:dTDP-4-dehydrorhamnose reductase
VARNFKKDQHLNIILIGKGQVGSALAAVLGDNSLLHWQSDIDDLSSNDILSSGAEAVINAAGRTDLAWCEANPREAFRSNIEAPVSLYKRIHHINRSKKDPIRFIHFSSGCVWDGPYDENGKPFTPYYPPSPAAFYSWTKAACDELLLREDENNVAILRPRQVYSSMNSPRNTLSKLIKYPKLVATDQSMSSIDIVIRTLQFILSASDEWSGIWNIYDKGIITPYTLGVMLAEAGLREMPQMIDKSELDTFHKPKRVDTVLFDERFERLIGPEDISAVLQRTIIEYAKNAAH